MSTPSPFTRRLRLYRTLFLTRSYRSRLFINLLAFLGATATVLQVAVWVFDIDEKTLRNGWVLLFLAAGLLIVAYRSQPPSRLEMVHSGFRARVIVERDDLLATTQHPIVLTANCHFDSGPEWVSELSLVGQLSSRWFELDGRTRLAERIDTALGVPSGIEALPVGTVARLAENGQTALLLSVSSRHPENRSAVLIDEIWTALSALWSYARMHDLHTVSMPVVGSGYAKARVGLIPLLMLQLTSYVTSAMEAPICAMRIVLARDSTDLDIFELTKSYCESLGFREK
jgi:hypothetical protein